MARGRYYLDYLRYEAFMKALGNGATHGDLLDYLNATTGNDYRCFEVIDAPIEFRRL